MSNRWTFDATLGLALGGSLGVDAQSFDIAPGGLVALSVSYRLVDDRGAAPFVLFSLSAAASYAVTTPTGSSSASSSLVATDLRLGVTVGKTFARIFTPYLAARVFGGPVFWTYAGQDATGTDAYHYQVGAGVSLALGRWNIHAEGDPLGEVTVSGGVGFAF